ncbi:MAG TPA: cytochrome c [Pseudomonadales bacterium]|nr:cytochrome c [Pseudomonadales bacterium]
MKKRVKIVWSLVGIVAVAALFGSGYIYMGEVDVAADSPHGPFVSWLLQTARERAVTMQSRHVVVPRLDDADTIAKGADEYAEMCAGCHLGPGVDDNEFRRGLYPPAPALASSDAHTRDPGEQFWILKHGLKLSAMPAWGPTHDDATLWSIVAFLQVLPTLTPERYAEMTQNSAAAHAHERDATEHDATAHDEAPDATEHDAGAAPQNE